MRLCPISAARALTARFDIFLLALIFSASSLCVPSSAQSSATLLAPVPPMGWNSWDAYGTTVREAEVKANADAMAKRLKPYGWQYIVVDIQWYEPNAKAHGYREGAVLRMDAYGRLIPAVNRFSSAAGDKGFKPLADYVHSKGLKFGIHILRGIARQAVQQNTPVFGTNVHAASIANKTSTCAWNSDMYGVDMSRPGAQAYYDSLVALYASWGVDFIKADDMTRPYHDDEIAALHNAILKSGRPIVLSLSPGPAPTDKVLDLRKNAEMWRIEDDLWDNWTAIKSVYADATRWLPLVAPGHWPDADMLPLGHIGIRAERGNDRMTHLTHNEQKTLLTLWSMLRSPLIFGGDLQTLDPFTFSLLTNADVLAINQHSDQAHVVLSKDDLHIWAASAEDGKAQYIAFFNLSDKSSPIQFAWREIGIDKTPTHVEELWTKEKLQSLQSVHLILPPHATALYKLTR